MVKIRLTRLGKHKNPFYRIIAIDSRAKRDGGYLELLGTYEPFSGKVNINSELVLKFLATGAQPSETVLNILKQKGIYKQFLQTKSTVKKTKKVRKTKKSKNKKTTTKAETVKKTEAK